MKKTMSRLLAALLALLMLAAAGCAPKPAATPDGPVATPAESGAPADTAAPAATAAEKKIIYSLIDDPEQLDPTLNSYSRSSIVLQQMFRGLYKTGSDGASVPAMAESVKISDDLLTYTFTLRKGLKWSDGSPLTASDFVYSWKRVVDPATTSKTASSLKIIKNADEITKGTKKVDELGVSAPDDTTLIVELANPTPWFLSLTGTTAFLPIKKATVDANGENWTKDPKTYICSGPFMLSEFKSKEKLSMVKNPNYYAADEVKIDGVDIMIIEAAETKMAAYANGEINVADNLVAADVAKYKDTPEYNAVPRIGLLYCDFNVEKAPFDKPEVRQAFAMSINRSMILSNILQTAETPVFGWVPAAQPSLTDPSKPYRVVAGDMFKEDVAAAKELLAKAGFPDGKGFPAVTMVVQADQRQKDMAQAMQSMWKENLGVQVEITTFESKVYWDELDAGNFNISRNGWTGDYLDPMANLEIFETGGSGYENRWDNTDYDAIIKAARSATDPAEREKLFIQAEQFLVKEMPVMPVYNYVDTFVVKPNIHGVIKNYIGHICFEYATID